MSIRPNLVGRQITGFSALWQRTAWPCESDVANAIVKQTIRDVARRGKYIVLHLHGGGACLIHLKMSGRLTVAEGPITCIHTRAVWTLTDGSRLVFNDPRKFGRVRFVSDYGAFSRTLGLEPLSLDFTPAVLEEILKTRRRLKPLLLDQTVIAGLGNIYTDESLFRARLHPLLCAARVKPALIRTLHAGIRAVLREAIRYQGTSIDWVYAGGRMQRRLAVYGRSGKPCPGCGRTIVRLVVGGRGTYVCPSCQRPPRG